MCWPERNWPWLALGAAALYLSERSARTSLELQLSVARAETDRIQLDEEEDDSGVEADDMPRNRINHGSLRRLI